MAAHVCVSELTIVGIVCLLSLYGLCQSQINRFMQGREKTMSRKNTQALNSIQRICHIQKISMEDILKSIMKSYNLFLFKGFTEALKQEVNSKINTKDGKSIKEENK